jgi:transcriptional regulator with XRE-family HTH domain
MDRPLTDQGCPLQTSRQLGVDGANDPARSRFLDGSNMADCARAVHSAHAIRWTIVKVEAALWRKPSDTSDTANSSVRHPGPADRHHRTTHEGTRVMTERAYDRTDLSDLIQDRRDLLGLTYEDLAAACVDPEAAGAPDVEPLWRRSTLHNLAQGRYVKPPTFPMLRALAAGLQVSLSTVQEAAGAQFFGIDTVWSPDGKVRALVRDFDDLDDEDQAKVLALMESRRRIKG